MSSYDTWLNVLTGISQGAFDKIYLRDASGNMVDLLTLLGTLGGGITNVISQSSELVVTTNGTTKILTLTLGGYSTTSPTNTAVTPPLASYVTSTALTNPTCSKAKHTDSRNRNLNFGCNPIFNTYTVEPATGWMPMST